MNGNGKMTGLWLALALIAAGRAPAFGAERTAPGRATVTESELELMTYPFSDPNPVPATGEPRYPYFFFDGATTNGAPRRWKAVVLENERIRVTVLPEIGGKVWGAVDKATGHEFIYCNHTAKFRNIALRGPWCSGGIEFNFGITGHAPSTSAPVSYFCRTNADGSASCFVSDSELICGTTWQVEIVLPPDADHFLTHVTWFNGSNLPAPYYQWSTAAYTARGDPEFCFPGTSCIGHDGKVSPWPVDAEGHDLSRSSGNAFGGPKSLHVTNGDGSIFGIWWPERNFGSVHRNHIAEKYGRKMFLWSQSRGGGIWEDLLTDTDGQYAELQSGRFFNQTAPSSARSPFRYQTFAPGATDTFTEEWECVRDRGEFDRAKDPANFVARPQSAPADFNWESAYGHYVLGEQLLRQRKDADGEKELELALGIEPCFAPALDELALLAVRRRDIPAAHRHAAKALAVNTYDPAANFADGRAAFLEGDLRRATERLGLAAVSPEFAPAAFALIAKAELRGGDLACAARFAGKSLAANALGMDALLLRIVLARAGGQTDEAARLARETLERFPLFHAARYELNLADPTSEPFMSYVRCEFPQEVCLSLGGWYEEAGLVADAEGFFRRAAERTAVGSIRLAALLERTGRTDEARAALEAAAKRPIAFSLPFRGESIPALEAAAKAHPSWKFGYYAAVALAANGRDAAADRHLDACGDRPDDPIFYLYRASRRTGSDRLADLRRAQRLGGGWRVGHALCRHFAEAKDWEAARREIEPYAKDHADVSDIACDYATALAEIPGREEEAIAFMRTVTVLPAEMSAGASTAWITAWGRIVENRLAAGDAKGAREAAREAISYPENLGVGRPYEIAFEQKGRIPCPYVRWTARAVALAKEVEKSERPVSPLAEKTDL